MTTNSIEVIRPFADALREESITNVQVFGGINTAALRDLKTVIDFDSKEVIAPATLYLDVRRSDRNKSLRDADVFVKSSDPEYIAYIEKILDEAVGTALRQSVFGIVPEKVLRRQLRHPFGFTALKTFLSDRYEQPDGIDLPDSVASPDRLIRSIFPFGVPIDAESLESWTLSVGDMRVDVPNPAMQVINYASRSVSGVRPKDEKKVKETAASILTKAPELRDWAMEGPGASQLDLCLLLRSLTPKKEHPDYFRANRRVQTLSELADSEYFMLPDLEVNARRRLVATVAFKANILSFFESNKTLVSLFQKYIESHMGTLVKYK